MDGATIFFLLFTSLYFHKIHAAELNTISSSQFLTDGDTLVSTTGIFELGFFRPGSSRNTYLGIWYKKIAVTTVVWVANRNQPIAGPSPPVLKIIDPGILVLFNNMNMTWTSNTTMTSWNATATLHDTGNLVVMNEHMKVLWQSFDYPTDTLLAGMKIGRDYLRSIVWHISPWKSSQDPAPDKLTWGADTHDYPDNKLKQGAVVKFRGGPWSNQWVSQISTFSRNLIITYIVNITEREVSCSYNLQNSSILSRVTLNSSGELQSWVWAEDVNKWHLYVSFPTDICDTYSICGAYGSCIIKMIQQSCTCLDDNNFVPRNQKAWDQADWSGGCVRRTKLDCKIGSEGFIKYSNLKLPDTESTWFNMSMNQQECEAKCLKNCSCMAYANTDTNLKGRGCLLWFNDLIDIRVYPEANFGQDIFVRIALSELVAQSTFKTNGGSNHTIMLLIVILGALLIGIISTWLWYIWRKRNHVEPIGGVRLLRVSESQEDIQLPLFSFSTIATATSSFSNKNILGEGGFGPVYKGVLEEGREIAVKRLSRSSSQGVNEFKNEVICISKVQHRNLVKLLGCCIHGDEKLLIYEYMSNKSLDLFIFGKTQSMLLDWTKRFNIIKGIARGLLYLHHDSRLRIIHRDLKASNILLDLNMNPKISDFGLARSFRGNETHANTKRVVGTYGYMSPEYALDGLFSMKSDVFSFGVLVLEIVSGKKNRGFNHPKHDNNLIGHAWGVYNEGKSMELIDECLAKSCDPTEVLRSIEVGLLCVQQNAKDRPCMSSVVMMLCGESALPKPKQPAFFIDTELLVAGFSLSPYPAGSINDFTITQLDAR